MDHRFRSGLWLAFIPLALISITRNQPAVLAPGGSIQLAAFSDDTNQVAVIVRLERGLTGGIFLSATFTAPAGYHLYSKDIPRGGVYGHGRPTLIELPAGAKMHPAGLLDESVSTEIFGHEPDGPPVYPDGPVTLTLPVDLPPSQAPWVADEISLTYMTCSMTTCDPPTVGKLVPVRVPGLAAVFNPSIRSRAARLQNRCTKKVSGKPETFFFSVSTLAWPG